MLDVTSELKVVQASPPQSFSTAQNRFDAQDGVAEQTFKPSRLSRFIPYLALRETRVPGQRRAPAFGRISALDEHLGMLAREFAGATQLEYTLACTIVMLRRGIEVKRNLARFRRIWFWHGRFLCRHLNSRWLISSADTLLDFPRTRAEHATAMAAVLLGSTVKLYETERRLVLADRESGTGEAFRKNADPNVPPVELFDGLTAFKVGCGDLIKNLDTRLAQFCQGRSTATRILDELMRRMRRHDSIYARLTRNP